jgi:hypothetical protein
MPVRPLKVIKQVIKCKMCGDKFENFARNGGTCMKEYCEYCLKKRQAAYEKGYNAKKRKMSNNDST